jgi:hypothetical protein
MALVHYEQEKSGGYDHQVAGASRRHFNKINSLTYLTSTIGYHSVTHNSAQANKALSSSA